MILLFYNGTTFRKLDGGIDLTMKPGFLMTFLTQLVVKLPLPMMGFGLKILTTWKLLAAMPSNGPISDRYKIYFNHKTSEPERVHISSIIEQSLDENLMWQLILEDAEWIVNCIKENMPKDEL